MSGGYTILEVSRSATSTTSMTISWGTYYSSCVYVLYKISQTDTRTQNYIYGGYKYMNSNYSLHCSLGVSNGSWVNGGGGFDFSFKNTYMTATGVLGGYFSTSYPYNFILFVQ